jgi:hypothetical protein
MNTETGVQLSFVTDYVTRDYGIDIHQLRNSADRGLQRAIVAYAMFHYEKKNLNDIAEVLNEPNVFALIETCDAYMSDRQDVANYVAKLKSSLYGG